MGTPKHGHGAEPEVLAFLVLHQVWEVAEEGLVTLTPHPLMPLSFLDKKARLELCLRACAEGSLTHEAM